MALVKYGAGISAYSGKIGGTVYARNRSGAYARNHVVPVNPSSGRQQTVRARMAQLSSMWNETLTQVQRDAWDVYAANVVIKNRLGEDIYLTGFNHYIRSNGAIMAAGLDIVNDGPTVFTLPGEDTEFSTTASEGTQLVSVAFDDTAEWLDEDGGAMLIHTGLPRVNSINFFKGPWRVAGSILGDAVTPPTTPATLTSSWQVAEGQKLFVRGRIIRADGRVSNFFRSHSTAAA